MSDHTTTPLTELARQRRLRGGYLNQVDKPAGVTVGPPPGHLVPCYGAGGRLEYLSLGSWSPDYGKGGAPPSLAAPDQAESDEVDQLLQEDRDEPPAECEGGQ